ncbi:hypothetical protein D3C87_2129060 [compost metagenome]
MSPAPISRSELSMSLKNRSNSAWLNSWPACFSTLSRRNSSDRCSEIMSKRPVTVSGMSQSA